MRWQGFRGRPRAFVEHWCQRNQYALEALETCPERVGIVRYEDLVADPKVFEGLCTWLELPGSYLFRRDHQEGRLEQPEEVQDLIDEGTADVLEQLDLARRVVAGQSGSLERTRERLVGRMRRQWSKLKGS